jgi:hypothetical protein
VPHHPLTCPACQTALSPSLPDAAPVRRQQVWEIPEVQPVATEHQYHLVRCPGCQVLVRADRPVDVAPGAFGPRVAAPVGLLRGSYHLSDQADVANGDETGWKSERQNADRWAAANQCYTDFNPTISQCQQAGSSSSSDRFGSTALMRYTETT